MAAGPPVRSWVPSPVCISPTQGLPRTTPDTITSEGMNDVESTRQLEETNGNNLPARRKNVTVSGETETQKQKRRCRSEWVRGEEENQISRRREGQGQPEVGARLEWSDGA